MIVTAVLVLYRMAPEQSPTFLSLREILLADPGLAVQLTLLVYDNSPGHHALPPLPCPADYRHDRANPGLAAAYNVALARAQASHSPWLLLLDQDTVLTAEWLAEALAALRQVPAQVDAVLPNLVQAGRVHSPHLLPRLSTPPLPPALHGIPARAITAFNSAALLRVQALERIGGFPTSFPLDFLDHAVFDLLASTGSKFYLLRARLTHDLSTSTLGGDASLARYRNILAAELRFYRRASGAHAGWHRLRRLKQAVGHLLKVRDKRFAWQDLRAALGLFKD